MNKRSTVSALFLASALLMSNCDVKAGEEKPVIIVPGSQYVIAGMLPVVAGWIVLYSRKSEKEFNTRFDSAKVTKASKLFSKDGIKNLWYFIADELIGQRKQSSTLKCKDGKIFPSEDTPAYGVLGNIDAIAAPLAEAAAKFTAPFTGIAALWIAMKKGADATATTVATVLPGRAPSANTGVPAAQPEAAATV